MVGVKSCLNKRRISIHKAQKIEEDGVDDLAISNTGTFLKIWGHPAHTA